MTSATVDPTTSTTSTTAPAPVVLAVPGTETGRVEVNHPTWGAVTVVTSIGDACREPQLTAFDATGEILWQPPSDECNYERFQPADPVTDGSGNLLFVYNPGRYDGVFVLRPIDGGFEDFRTLPLDLDAARFYYADFVDHDADGTFEIDLSSNNCDPSCAAGAITTKTFTWDGTDYRTAGFDPNGVTTDGLSPLQFGDSVGEAEELTGLAAGPACGGGGGSQVISDPDTGMLLFFSGGKFVQFEIAQTDLATPSGGRVGLTGTEIEGLIPYAYRSDGPLRDLIVESGELRLIFTVDEQDWVRLIDGGRGIEPRTGFC